MIGKMLAGLYMLGAVFLVLLFSMSYRSPGEVVGMTKHNGSCSRNSFTQCTLFRATVQYQGPDRVYTIPSPAGKVRGENHPMRLANRKVGDRVTVFYSAARPDYGLVVDPGHIWFALCLLGLPFAYLAVMLVLPKPADDDPLPPLDAEHR